MSQIACSDLSDLMDFISSIETKFVPLALVPIFSVIYNYILLPSIFDNLYNFFNPQYVADMDVLLNNELPKVENWRLAIVNDLNQLGIDINPVTQEDFAAVVGELDFLSEVVPYFYEDQLQLRIEVENCGNQFLDIHQKVKHLENNKKGTYFISQVSGIGFIGLGGLVTSAVISVIGSY